MYLLIQYKQRAQEQRSKVRYLGAAYREPVAVPERPVRAGTARVRTARGSCRSGRPPPTESAGPTLGAPGSDRCGRRRGARASSRRSTRPARSRSRRRGGRSARARRRSARCTGGEFREARALIAEAAAYLAEAESALAGHTDVRYGGFLHDAKKEFAEANLTLAFVADNPLPTAAELGVDVQPYLNGMAEAASELRRQVLDCLRADEGDEAERLLALMDDVYGLLVTDRLPRRAHRRAAPLHRRAARRARAHPRRRHHRDRRRPSPGRDRGARRPRADPAGF